MCERHSEESSLSLYSPPACISLRFYATALPQTPAAPGARLVKEAPPGPPGDFHKSVQEQREQSRASRHRSAPLDPEDVEVVLVGSLEMCLQCFYVETGSI